MPPGNVPNGLATRVNISAIQADLRSAGPWLRTEIFFYGCTQNCPGCINQWVQEEGHFNELTVSQILEEVVRFNNFHVSIGGGEPFEQEEPLAELVYWLSLIIKDQKGSVLLYTGFEWEKVRRHRSWFFPYLDYIVTGPYIEEKSFEKVSDSFVGSSNQQVIALRNGQVSGVLKLDDYGRIAVPRGV
jgi:anaerobic ribonucleoside-triphosphate reductase activating protein